MIDQILPPAVLALNITLLASAGVYAAKRAGYSHEYLNLIDEKISENTTKIVFGVSLVATLGSLYYSNVLGYEPCRLCWYQRILMYPITLISGTALFLEREDIKDYVLSLTLIGIPLALYHALIQRYEQFHSAGCSVTAVSCSTEYTFHYGYITIPVMALTAFLVITVVLWRYRD